MRISYDRGSDAAYIRLDDASEPQHGAQRVTTRAELPPGLSGFIALDWDGQRLIGIEILDASARISPTILKQADPTN